MVGPISNEEPPRSKWDRTIGSSALATAAAAGTCGSNYIYIIVIGDSTAMLSKREEKPVNWAEELKKLAVEARLAEDVYLSIYAHIVPDLSYLYRPPVRYKTVYKRLRHHIHQPCWRRGRWKSLT